MFSKLGNTSETLHELDCYCENHYPTTIGNQWFTPEGFSKYANKAPLITLHAKVMDLFQPMLEIKAYSIAEGCEAVRTFLMQVYGEDELDRNSRRLASLTSIFGAINVFDSLPQQTMDSIGDISVSLIIELMLQLVESDSIPEYPNDQSIDLVGWLETIHEDSPCLFVVGMDSSLVNASSIGSPHIPNRLRKELGLVTVERKLARDAHAVLAIQSSRIQQGCIKWIVARKSLENDPLTANPLLLRTEDDVQLAKRANKLIVDLGVEEPHVPDCLLKQGSPSSMPEPRIPCPTVISTEPLNVLAATAFKDFIACTYRFWLRHVLKLGEDRDDQTELDYKLFGTLVHGALERFGKDTDVRDSDDEGEIASFLYEAVDQEVIKLFGKYPKSTINLQVTMAKQRLRQFSQVQVEHVLEGWKIVETECKVEWNVGTQEDSFLIKGKIDRIDQHVDGRVLVLDYKTGSTTALKAHRSKGEWKDLQLPIYRKLAECLGFPIQELKTGYILIGSRENKVTFDVPDWDEEVLNSANGLILEIVDQIRDNKFDSIPSSPAPVFFEDLSWICQDAGIISSPEGDIHELI